MNISFFIARRYLLSKRKKNFINIISILSMAGVAFITAALIIVLSVFNGLEDLLRSLNNSFDPQIRVEAAEGKTFQTSPALIEKVKQVKGVQYVTEVIEDWAYARYRDANQVVMLKGVSENFIDQKRIPEESIVDGELRLYDGKIPYAIVGLGVQYNLSIATGKDAMYPLQLYYIKNTRTISSDPSSMYSRMNILPGGVFSIVQQFNESYVIVPLKFAEELLNYENKRTSLEIKINDGADVFSVEDDLQRVLGQTFNVLNHEEQHKDLYRLLKMEKLFTFLAFTLLLGVGSINIFFSLMMLALDKKKDISVLSAMGADQRLVRNIFLVEGALIAFSGTVIGLMLGGLFCIFQSRFGIISMGMETSVMQGYPVKVVWTDFLYTLLTVSVITILISMRPAVLASRFNAVQHL